MDSGAGTLTPLAAWQFEQQVSAVAVLRIPDGEGTESQVLLMHIAVTSVPDAVHDASHGRAQQACLSASVTTERGFRADKSRKCEPTGRCCCNLCAVHDFCLALQTWVAVGQWVTNELLLRRLSHGGASTSETGSTSTADMRLHVPGGQARSAVVASLAGRTFLCVGTAAGDLLYVPLEPDGSGSLRAGPSRLVTVGTSGVSLESVPAHAGCPAYVYAQSDQALCLRARQHASPDTGAGTQAARKSRCALVIIRWPLSARFVHEATSGLARLWWKNDLRRLTRLLLTFLTLSAGAQAVWETCLRRSGCTTVTGWWRPCRSTQPRCLTAWLGCQVQPGVKQRMLPTQRRNS